MQAIQDKRAAKSIFGGRKLHHYANLYFHARNPMLFKRRFEDVCVLRISVAVLKLQSAVITDQNAASKYCRPSTPSEWRNLDFDDIFAADWKHPDDQIREWQHTSRKCAEVLIPDLVQPSMLIGAYVPDIAARVRLDAQGFGLPISIHPNFFFR